VGAKPTPTNTQPATSSGLDWPFSQPTKLCEKKLAASAVREVTYNLMTREIEMEVLPAARHLGIGVIPWSPLHGGLLGGVLAAEGRRRRTGRAAEALEANRDRIAAYETLCAALGEEPANVALAWLLHQEGVSAPIVGPRTVEQLDAAVRAVEVHLAEETLAALDRLFPGYRPSPEHYAW